MAGAHVRHHRLPGGLDIGSLTVGAIAPGRSTMGRRKIPYPPEFRDEAVHLVREGGKSIGQVVKDLGIADQSLRNWIKQADLDAGRRTDGLTTEERAELRRLRRENRVLKEERAILVKAVAFFAQETHSKPGRPSSS